MLSRDAERVEPTSCISNDCIDFRVGARQRRVVGPFGEDVADGVDVSDDAEQLDERRRGVIRRCRAIFECLPQCDAVLTEGRQRLAHGHVEAAQDLDEVVGALRLRLAVASERCSETPISGTRSLGDIDELREFWR